MTFPVAVGLAGLAREALAAGDHALHEALSAWIASLSRDELVAAVEGRLVLFTAVTRGDPAVPSLLEAVGIDLASMERER